MSKKMATEQFIERARKVHGDKYERKPHGYWTKERVFNESKAYKSRVEFVRHSPSAYNIAWKNGWLEEMKWLICSHKPDGFWTKERILDISKQYRNKNEFKAANSHAYQKARVNGWLSEMTWLEPRAKSKWTRDLVFEEARKYSTRNDFKHGYEYVYNIARRKGWIEEMKWFLESAKPIGYWSRERVFDESHKFTTRSDFAHNSPTAYEKARENGWLDNMDWLMPLKKPTGFWTRDRVFEAARKYESRSMFASGVDASAYKVAMENNWLDEMTWLHTPVPGALKNERVHSVYSYVDEDNKVVYVGRTKNLKNRHQQHRSARIHDIVYRYFTELGKDVPQPVLLISKLLPEESQAEEKNYTEWYYNNGYRILNDRRFVGIGKGSLGGGYIKWTKEAVLEESKKYNRRNDFIKGSPSAYNAARMNGWLGEITWHKMTHHKAGYWDVKEHVLVESLKYKSRVEFAQNSVMAWNAARKNGWMDEMTWLKRPVVHNKKWTKEMVFDESQKYESRSSFKSGSSTAYNIAKNNGWLDKMVWLIPQRETWTKEKVITEAHKYSTRRDFSIYSRKAYDAARRLNIMDELTWLSKSNKKL